MYDTDALRWRALENRDFAASSHFVYAVVSTKIYCRPGCPSRLARRANVYFYDTPKEAAAAGYRPCLRCKPDQADVDPDGHRVQRDAVKKACLYIEQTNGKAKFAEVAKHVGLSTRYLYGLFKDVLGTTPAKYAAVLGLNSRKGEICSGTPSAASGTGSGSGSDAVSVVTGNDVESTLQNLDSWMNLDYTDLAFPETFSDFPWEDFNVSGALSSSPSIPCKVIAADVSQDWDSWDQFDPFLPIISSQELDGSHLTC